MKLLFLMIMTLALGTARGAAPDPISRVVLESFQNNFRNVDEVSWAEGKYFFKAEFQFNGQYVNAFFTKNGYLAATSKNLRFTELPLQLQLDLKGSYTGYWISDLFELTREGSTSYYITLENADQKIVLESFGNDWSLFNKSSK